MRRLDRTDPVAGKNLTLHLNAKLQMAAEQALGDFRGAVVAIEPATGGILAMVSNPDLIRISVTASATRITLCW